MTFFPTSSLNGRIRENLSRGTSWSTEFFFAGELLAVTRGPLRQLLNLSAGRKVLKLAIVSKATKHLGEPGLPLPPVFCKEELQTLLEIWEGQDCPFQSLHEIVNLMPEATYQGSVLRERTSLPADCCPVACSQFLHYFGVANSQQHATKMCQTHGCGRQRIQK